ncbi:ferredoxin [Methylobacterium sp. 4-46]|uniref:2Fe-2S iron-sulfur cluster-binding protein n=1 Tax=unclassified Methylobacterium TaxID=2615210 RepID=UPI000152C81D|nr:MULTISPECIES: 2Fe-2S iron-sulfur cluster-binding protein [Methylobacterium]ACA17114.1 ferredoxin [Methylobacterium sp. 4-46]WFT82799.1 2Fe-2S iron-sulfur cluster-binding protein [Methylobacterium nodulans]
MASSCSLVVNGKTIRAARGDTLVDAAMTGGVVIPHDCATGQCDTCRVRVYAGEVDESGTRQGDTVLACQARVAGDAVIEFDAVPPVAKRRGTLVGMVDLSHEIVEVTVALAKPLTSLPGQYVSCAFAGFPARDYSPTLRSDGSGEINELIFHIRRVPDGAVSAELGGRIRPGHDVQIRGPFGSAFHRLGPGRLVLIGAGTGWAPIWSIARAARFREPGREMMVIAGARDPRNLYMGEALDWLRRSGVERVIATASGGEPGPGRLAGRPTAHLPLLRESDVVHVAGSPGLVAAVRLVAAGVNATCYADPFVASARKRTIRHALFDLLFARRPRAEPGRALSVAAPAEAARGAA